MYAQQKHCGHAMKLYNCLCRSISFTLVAKQYSKTKQPLNYPCAALTTHLRGLFSFFSHLPPPVSQSWRSLLDESGHILNATTPFQWIFNFVFMYKANLQHLSTGGLGGNKNNFKNHEQTIKDLWMKSSLMASSKGKHRSISSCE